ncbi:MAG TPA: TonB-dependent receptor [Pyrinomonadaceae bacterium]|nr:TonB-dependent receptor [Pyrinomonadaceae bacterium]
MRSHKLFAFVLAAFALAFTAAPVLAQSDRGSITGTVSDPNGAVVGGATVRATSLDTGEVREATTTGEGGYTLPELRASLYRVSVEAQGFKTSTVEQFKVAVQVVHTLDFTLELGVVTDVVTVTSESTPVIQSDTPVRQTNVNERQVRELPLQVNAETAGRSPLAFIFLDSNVTAAAGNGTNATNFRVSGGQGLGSEILIDGAATRRAQNGTFFTEVSPSPNAFQEFTVSTSSYSAEFGNSSGGIVNFSIKSGGNQFHGEAYEYHRNDAFNANSYLNNLSGLDRPRNHQNNFGFNVGGPMYFPRFGEGGPTYWSGKNRAFFFFNYEGYRFAESENVFLTVPTLRMRQGDFGELLTDPAILARFGPGGVRIFDPTSGGFGERTAIPGNNIPAYQTATGRTIIDPVGFNILQLFPLPTRQGVFQNYQASTQRPLTMNQYVGKADFVLTPMQTLAFSYSYRKQNTIQGGAPRFPQPLVAAGRWNQFFVSHFARLQHNWTMSPNLLNHFNAGFTRFSVANQNTTIGFNNTTLGLRANSTQNKAFPLIGFPGYSDPADPRGDPRSYQGMGSTFFHDQSGDNAVQLTDFMTLLRGNHSMRFGADVRIQQFNVSQLVHPGGEFNFRHNQTSNVEADNEGWPIASLITGATEFSFNSVQTIDPGWRQFSHSYFFQDDWKLRQNLTVNLGIRYDLPGLRTESKNRFRGFDPFTPNPAAGGRLGAIVGAGGQGGLQAEHESLASPDRTNIGPRVGFAYAWNDRTVVRGGAGVYYAPIVYGAGGQNNLTGGTIGFNTPVQPNVNCGPPGARGCVGGVPDLFLRNYRATLPVDPAGQFLGSDVDYFDPDFKTSRTVQYSLDLQRELPWNFAASIGYIGHRATRLRSNFERLNAIPFNALRLGNELLNRPLAEVNASERAFAASVGVPLPASNNAVFPGFNGTVGQALRRFPQYRTITNQLESQGQSWYNAMQLKLDRRFSQGIQFGASYTFSKLITDASEDLLGASPIGSLLQNPYDRESLRTVSPNSIPHVFVFNYIIEIPLGKGRRFLDQGGVVNAILGGWQLSGIHRYQSGLPLVVRVTRQGAFGPDTTGFNTDIRPNLTGQQILTSDPRSEARVRIINPAAFTAPPSYTNDAPPARREDGTVNPAYIAFYADPNRFFGNAPPVIDQARDLPFLSENLSLLKKFYFTETVAFEVGAEAFNIFNRHRLAQPNSDLSAGGDFGFSGVDAGYRQREIQIRVRFMF